MADIHKHICSLHIDEVGATQGAVESFKIEKNMKMTEVRLRPYGLALSDARSIQEEAGIFDMTCNHCYVQFTRSQPPDG